MESTQPSLIKFFSASLKDALTASQITRHARFVIRPVVTHSQDLLAYRQYQTVKAGTMLALFLYHARTQTAKGALQISAPVQSVF